MSPQHEDGDAHCSCKSCSAKTTMVEYSKMGEILEELRLPSPAWPRIVSQPIVAGSEAAPKIGNEQEVAKGGIGEEKSAGPLAGKISGASGLDPVAVAPSISAKVELTEADDKLPTSQQVDEGQGAGSELDLQAEEGLGTGKGKEPMRSSASASDEETSGVTGQIDEKQDESHAEGHRVIYSIAYEENGRSFYEEYSIEESSDEESLEQDE